MENIRIKIPALKRLTLEELKKHRSYISSIEKDESTEEEVVMELTTVLKDGEDYIDGKEYEKRIKKLPLLGFQHLIWLTENQPKELKDVLGKIYIDFPGIVVVGVDGGRSIPCARRDGERWDGNWLWLGGVFSRRGRVAVSGKSALSVGSGRLEDSDTCSLPASLVINGVKYIRQ